MTKNAKEFFFIKKIKNTTQCLVPSSVYIYIDDIMSSFIIFLENVNLGTGGKVKHGGKKMAGYWNLAGIWRRESNDSRHGIIYLTVMWNDPLEGCNAEIYGEREEVCKIAMWMSRGEDRN